MSRRLVVELTEPDGWPNDEQAAEFEELLPCPIPVGTTSREWIAESIWKVDGVWYVIVLHNEVNS